MAKDIKAVEILLPNSVRFLKSRPLVLSPKALNLSIKGQGDEAMQHSLSFLLPEEDLILPIVFFALWMQDNYILNAIDAAMCQQDLAAFLEYSSLSYPGQTSSSSLFLAVLGGHEIMIEKFLESSAKLSATQMSTLLAVAVACPERRSDLFKNCERLQFNRARFWGISVGEITWKALNYLLEKSAPWSTDSFIEGIAKCLDFGVSPHDLGPLVKILAKVRTSDRRDILGAEDGIQRVALGLIQLGIHISGAPSEGNWEEENSNPTLLTLFGEGTNGECFHSLSSEVIRESFVKRQNAWVRHREMIFSWMLRTSEVRSAPEHLDIAGATGFHREFLRGGPLATPDEFVRMYRQHRASSAVAVPLSRGFQRPPPEEVARARTLMHQLEKQARMARIRQEKLS
ncbi:hypothetical protein ABW19_dt0207235 [Dactylella cylindrospora]|nr:hypothetical protein ABW19_dt0207235 [Dactylella cylindrospora]